MIMTNVLRVQKGREHNHTPAVTNRSCNINFGCRVLWVLTLGAVAFQRLLDVGFDDRAALLSAGQVFGCGSLLAIEGMIWSRLSFCRTLCPAGGRTFAVSERRFTNSAGNGSHSLGSHAASHALMFL